MSSRQARVRLLVIVFFVVVFSLYWYQQNDGDAPAWPRVLTSSAEQPVTKSKSKHPAQKHMPLPPGSDEPAPPPPPPAAFDPTKAYPTKQAEPEEATLKDAQSQGATSKDNVLQGAVSKHAVSKVSSSAQKPLDDKTTHKPSTQRPISSLPDIYQQKDEELPFCADRFGLPFLHHLNASAQPYCTAASSSQMTCFHVMTSSPRRDSLCIGGPLSYDDSRMLFNLDCATENERYLTTLESYWYDTGPGLIFREFVDSQPKDKIAPAAPKNVSTILLMKREGSANLWHSLMEIFAATMTLDTISMGVDPRTGVPIMQHDKHLSKLRIVILDDHEKGPYWDLWESMSPLPLTRIEDLTPDMVEGSQMIVPLAGGANPFWQGDWDVLSCSDSALLDAFVRRVLTWLKMPAADQYKTKGSVRITYVDRREKRKLAEQTEHVEALRKRIPDAEIDVVDFAQLSFAEQIAKARDTDVLVGVHGAGLTHAMFMAQGTAVVEIMPEKLDHKGFRNLAKLRGLQYFGMHGGEVEEGADWHDADVELDTGRFVRLVDVAAASVANQGLRNHDIRR